MYCKAINKFHLINIYNPLMITLQHLISKEREKRKKREDQFALIINSNENVYIYLLYMQLTSLCNVTKSNTSQLPRNRTTIT